MTLTAPRLLLLAHPMQTTHCSPECAHESTSHPMASNTGVDMTNQERNREALIQHVADLEAIIRRRNEQIAAQVETIEGARRDLADYQATHSRQIETIARLQKNPRPLTPDAITNEARVRARAELTKFIFDGGQVESSEGARVRAVDIILTAALTEPPARPEGAEEIERLLAEDLGDFRPPVTPEAIADLLAVRGVRVTGKDN